MSAEAAWHCEQALLRMFRCLDRGHIDALLNEFAPDGSWLRHGHLLQGHGGIRTAMEERSATLFVRHVVTNLIFDSLDDTQASATAQMVAYRFDNGAPVTPPARITAPFLLMSLTIRFIRAGAWRLSALEMRRDFEFVT